MFGKASARQSRVARRAPKDGLGTREATHYQRRALPLTLLAAAALGDLDPGPARPQRCEPTAARKHRVGWRVPRT